MFDRIIVVCTGNICRSPIAERLLQLHFQGTATQVDSAGTAALVNYPADPMAQLVMEEHGYDIKAHRARQATQALLTSRDLILTLDQSHNDWISSRFPQLLGRTHKLGRWLGNKDVADPYRQPKAAFDQAYADIVACATEWARRLKR
jgi:protein-tyrosine phosphatase